MTIDMPLVFVKTRNQCQNNSVSLTTKKGEIPMRELITSQPDISWAPTTKPAFEVTSKIVLNGICEREVKDVLMKDCTKQ